MIAVDFQPAVIIERDIEAALSLIPPHSRKLCRSQSSGVHHNQTDQR